MEIKICHEKVTMPPRVEKWNQSLAKRADSPPAPWCGVTLLRIEPRKELIKKHRLDRRGFSWVGPAFNSSKLEAIEDFERNRSTVGIGLASKKGFFAVIRSGNSSVKRLADSNTSRLLASCPIWPIAVKATADQLALEFVAAGDDSLWSIVRCWNNVLHAWGITSYLIEAHAEEDAWEQLDVWPAFLYFSPSQIRFFREEGLPERKQKGIGNSQVCRFADGVLIDCENGRGRNFVP